MCCALVYGHEECNCGRWGFFSWKWWEFSTCLGGTTFSISLPRQLKLNFVKTNNSLRQSKSSVLNLVLLILTKIQLFKSMYLCRTFYVSKHILRSGVFFIKSNGEDKPLFLQFSHLSTKTVVVELWDDCVTIQCSFTPISRSPHVICNR